MPQAVQLASGTAGGSSRPSKSQPGLLSILQPQILSIHLEMLSPTLQNLKFLVLVPQMSDLSLVFALAKSQAGNTPRLFFKGDDVV